MRGDILLGVEIVGCRWVDICRGAVIGGVPESVDVLIVRFNAEKTPFNVTGILL